MYFRALGTADNASRFEKVNAALDFMEAPQHLNDFQVARATRAPVRPRYEALGTLADSETKLEKAVVRFNAELIAGVRDSRS
jgi:hypothetical protein